jgi:hypothetical protein
LVTELAQCHPHVLREHRLFVSVTQRLTNMACSALLDHAKHAKSAVEFALFTHSENPPSSAFGLGKHVLEKREDVLMQETNEKEGGKEKREDGLMQDDDVAHARKTGETEGADVDNGDVDNGDSLATEAEKQCDVLVRALRLVLQSEGAKEAISACARQLDVICSSGSTRHRMVELVLLRTCSEAALASTLQCLQPDVAASVLKKLVDAVDQESNMTIRRLGIQCAADILKALDLNWSHELLQRLLRRLLQDVRASAFRNTDNADNTQNTYLEDVRASASLSDAHAQGGAQGGAVEAHKSGAAEGGEAEAEGGEAEAVTMHSRDKTHDTENTDNTDHTDNIASSRALAAIMTRVQIDPAVDELLPELVAVFGLLLSSTQGKIGANLVQQAALESLAAVATVAKRRMPPHVLATALQAIDPFLLCQLATNRAPGNSEEGMTHRQIWVESIECLAALAIAGKSLCPAPLCCVPNVFLICS